MTSLAPVVQHHSQGQRRPACPAWCTARPAGSSRGRCWGRGHEKAGRQAWLDAWWGNQPLAAALCHHTDTRATRQRHSHQRTQHCTPPHTSPSRASFPCSTHRAGLHRLLQPVCGAQVGEPHHPLASQLQQGGVHRGRLPAALAHVVGIGPVGVVGDAKHLQAACLCHPSRTCSVLWPDQR